MRGLGHYNCKAGDTVSQGSCQVQVQWFSEQGIQEPRPHACPALGLPLHLGRQPGVAGHILQHSLWPEWTLEPACLNANSATH